MELFKTKHIVIITFYIFTWISALPTTYGENEKINKTALVYRNITSRDRSSAKFISERLKVSSNRDEKQNKSWTSSSAQGNRRAIINSRLKLNDECERNCQQNENDENCKLKCDFDSKLSSNNTVKLNESPSTYSSANNKTNLPELNLIPESKVDNGKDEILESEESVIVVDSISNNDSGYRTKELSKTSKTDKMEKYLKNMILLKSRTTTKIVKRKATISSSSTNTQRSKPTVYRGRVKYSPSSSRIREESFIPYGSTIRYSNFSRIYTQGFQPATSSLRTKEKDLEIMEVSDAKQSSTEKMRFLKSRNIIAMNNYVKRLNQPRIAGIPKLNVNRNVTEAKSSVFTTEMESTSTQVTILDKFNTTDIPVPNIDNDISTLTIRDDFSTSPSSTVVPEERTTIEYSTKAPEVIFQEISTTTKSIITTLPPSTTVRTTKRFYTSIPRRKQLTTYSTTPKAVISTIPSVLNNTAVRNLDPTAYFKIPMASTTTKTTTATPPYVNDQHSITEVPIEIEVLPSIKSSDAYTTTTTNRPHILYEPISTTSVNDVAHVEAQRLNVTAYALGGFCFLPVLLVAMYFVKSYMMRHKSGGDYHADNDIQPISPVVTLNNSDDVVYFEESDDSLTTFNRNKLRFKSLLGEGNFGQVWKAEIDDINGSTKIVAVKTERINNGQSGLKSECEIMQKLASHPNVVTIIAACVEQEPHLLIMEFAMRGRLLSLLRTARSVTSGLHHNTQNRQPIMPLSPRRLTGFAHDIAKGMEYIANKRIVHCDLAARNVLLDHNGVCKICDFGMSIDLDKMESSRNKSNQMKIPRVSTHQKKFKFDMTSRVFDGIKNYASKQTRSNCDMKNRPAMPVRWMAPEALQYHVYSIETDVFAFGILLWEIVTLGITPYPTLSGREVIRGVLNGVRPEIPLNCKQELSDIMTHCWHKNPNQRPQFFDIRKSLASALLHWQEEPSSTHTEYLDVSGFSEDYENGMIYFNRRISEFECEI